MGGGGCAARLLSFVLFSLFSRPQASGIGHRVMVTIVLYYCICVLFCFVSCLFLFGGVAFSTIAVSSLYVCTIAVSSLYGEDCTSYLVLVRIFLPVPGGVFLTSCLKKNQNAPRPSEHPPVRGEKMSKRLGGIKGCKYKTSSWHLNGFPDGNNIGSTV